jgi:hypothetical protein
MVNDEHYKELRSVIDSLPNWTSLNEVKRYQEDESSDVESEFETEMESEITTSEEEEEEEDDDDEDEDDDDEDDGQIEQNYDNFSADDNTKTELKPEDDSGTSKRKDSLITDDEDASTKSSRLRTENSNNKNVTIQDQPEDLKKVAFDVKEDTNKDTKEDDYRPFVSPGNSVVINLNAELNRAFGEGSLLPLHRHVSPQQDNVHNPFTYTLQHDI